MTGSSLVRSEASPSGVRTAVSDPWSDANAAAPALSDVPAQRANAAGVEGPKT